MELRVPREPTDAAGRTFGTLLQDGQRFCDTLEDAIREQIGIPVAVWKVPGATAIPAGRYRVTLVHSPHFGRKVPLLHDVPGFDAIEIHPGTTTLDTRGCLLLGYHRTRTGLEQSRLACDTLTTRIAACLDPVWITLENPPPCVQPKPMPAASPPP